MLELPQVTLIALTNKDFEAHKTAMDISSLGIKWGGKKIIWDDTLTSIDDWNKKIVYDLWKYVDTEFAFLFHGDGYVIHPELWNPNWLKYDYIGAPWPLPTDHFSYRDEQKNLVRVGNSVGLRSRRLLKLPTDLNMEWKAYHGYTNEDGFFCCNNKVLFEKHGMKFAPLEVALTFSKEHEIPENKNITTFAFHAL